MSDVSETPSVSPSPAEPHSHAVSGEITNMISSIPLLKLAISSAGVAGILTAIGYLIETARESLLGISLPGGRAVSDYIAAGGEFFAFVLGLLWRHLAITLVALVVVVGAAIAIHFVRARGTQEMRRVRWTIGFIVVLAALSIKSFVLDHPYISMSDILSQPPLCESVALQGDALRQHEAWERFLCSRNDLTLSSRVGCRPAMWESSAGMTKHGGLSVEQMFLIDVFLTLFLSYLALVLYLSESSSSYTGASLALLRLLLLGVVGTNLLALPYVYGKVVRSTRLPAGQLIVESVDEAGQPALASVTSLIVAASDKFVTVYDLQEQRFLLLERPRVRWLSINKTDDIVARRTVATIDHSNCP